MRYTILASLLLATPAWANNSNDLFEIGVLASKAALCGERDLYLTLQSNFQLDDDYERGKSAGTKAFPSVDECKTLKAVDIDQLIADNKARFD